MINKFTFSGSVVGLFFGLASFVSCNGIFMDKQESNTPQNNFDLLWRIVDERYCFFEEKQIDWDGIYARYCNSVPRSTQNIHSESQLFDLMSNMLAELQDGHVSIGNGTEWRTYDGWFTKYSENYDGNLIYNYLNRRTEYLNNGMSFTSLSESVGYIRCSSFSEKINRTELDKALAGFTTHKGIIIDMRNNGGGLVSEAYTLASRFVRQKTHVGYVRYKTGKGHNDFSEYFNRYAEPDGTSSFQGKVVVITNRRVYSAANLFVSIMKNLPQVRIMGDTTGGGGGLPLSMELYNGWMVELSTNPIFDIDKKSIESGIEPHQVIMLEQRTDKKDNIIESAKDWILGR